MIDSFNLHITRGKKPNLAHSMLCHLTETLRSRVVMTTNFDSLLEDAFEQLHEHPEVLSVSIHGQLPSYTTVHSLNCILKLHGTLIETRADFSLDTMPTLDDRDRFFHYICGHRPHRSAKTESNPPLPLDRRDRAENHLLVLGYSGSDNRCVQLIKHVLEHSPRTKLFWVCYSAKDLKSLERLFPEAAYQIPHSRIVVTATDRPDLLLLELYQNLNLCLPRGGFALQFAHHVPPKLWSVDPNPGESECVGDLGRAIVKQVEERSKEILEARGRVREASGHAEALPDRPLVVKVEGRPNVEAGKVDVTGMMVVLRDAVEALKRKHYSTIWLEMEEFASVVQLAHEIFLVLSVRMGRYQLEHAISIPNRFVDEIARPKKSEKTYQNTGEGMQAKQPDDPDDTPEKRMRARWDEVIKEFVTYLGAQTEKTVIFCYGRNVPGMSASWCGAPWGEKEYASFWVFMRAMCAAGFVVVYSPYTKERRDHDDNNKKRFDELANTVSDRCGSDQDRMLKKEALDFRREFDPFSRKPWAESKQEDGVDPFVEVDSKQDREKSHEEVSCKPFRGAPVVEMLAKMVNSRIRDATGRCGPGNTDRAMRTALAELNFLYGISLFRRARHYTALLTEGVTPAPRVYNTVGFDNDWRRSRLVDRWLLEYRELSLIWRKPGGSSWLFRDARLGLQLILQACHSIPQNQYDPKKPDEQKWVAHAGQMRARMHLWIARWNVRAYFSTGHVMPLLEAFHHLYSCAETAPYAWSALRKKEVPTDSDLPAVVPKRVLAYRRLLWIKAMTLCVKILRLGRHSLLFWLDRSSAEDWFGLEVRQKLIKALNQSMNQVFRARIPADETGAAPSHRGIMHKVHAERLLKDLEGELLACWGDLDRQYMLPWFPKVKFTAAMGPSDDGSQSAQEINFPEWESWLGKFCYYLRDSKTGKDWRNFDDEFGTRKREDAPPEAGESVTGVFPDWDLKDWKIKLKKHFPSLDNDLLGWPKEEGAIEKCGSDLRRALRALIWKTAGSLDAIHDLPRVGAAVGYLAFGHIRRAKIVEREYLARRMNETRFGEEYPIHWGITLSHQESAALWIQTAVLCRCVLEYCSIMPPAMLEYDLSIQVNAITNHGLASGHVGRFFEAHRRLNEADAFLSKLPRRVDSTELAVVRLRQAEIHLQEGTLLDRLQTLLLTAQKKCKEIKRLKDKIERKQKAQKKLSWNDDEMREFFSGQDKNMAVELPFFFQSPTEEFLRGGRIADREKVNSGTNTKVIRDVFRQWFANYQIPDFSLEESENAQKHLARLARARVDDAWASLESAERLLSGRTRTSQWWGRLCTLKLRVFGRYRRDCTFRPLAFRRQIDYNEEITRVFRLGLAVWPDDPYRQIRLAECFLGAWARMNPLKKDGNVADLSSEGWKLVQQALKEDGGYSFDKDAETREKFLLLISYRKHVIHRLSSTWKALNTAPFLSNKNWPK